MKWIFDMNHFKKRNTETENAHKLQKKTLGKGGKTPLLSRKYSTLARQLSCLADQPENRFVCVSVCVFKF